MVEVIPAILEKDFSEIERKIHLVEGFVSWVQIDIADSTLVDNTTFLNPMPFARLISLSLKTGDASGGFTLNEFTMKGPPISAQSSRELEHLVGVTNGRTRKLQFELHMMVMDPLRYLERFANVGFKRFYAHVEGDYVEDYISKCYQLGVEVGLAIDGPTPIAKIHPYIDNIDCVLVMAIEIGASGRPFRKDTTEKIKRIREIDLEVPISVDGSMIPENAKKVVAAGATRINSNSYIFQAKDIKIAIEQLKELGQN